MLTLWRCLLTLVVVLVDPVELLVDPGAGSPSLLLTSLLVVEWKVHVIKRSAESRTMA